MEWMDHNWSSHFLIEDTVSVLSTILKFTKKKLIAELWNSKGNLTKVNKKTDNIGCIKDEWSVSKFKTSDWWSLRRSKENRDSYWQIYIRRFPRAKNV